MGVSECFLLTTTIVYSSCDLALYSNYMEYEIIILKQFILPLF